MSERSRGGEERAGVTREEKKASQCWGDREGTCRGREIMGV